MNKKGFSLIELMIVVCIMSILSAIVAPNMFKYIMSSRNKEAKEEAYKFYQACITEVGSNTPVVSIDFRKNNLPNLFSPNPFVINSLLGNTTNKFTVPATGTPCTFIPNPPGKLTFKHEGGTKTYYILSNGTIAELS